MENIKIDGKEIAVLALDAIDYITCVALIGRIVSCFRPRCTKKIIDFVYTLAYSALSTKLAGYVTWGKLSTPLHDVNANFVNAVSDLIDAFYAAKTQKNMA